MKATGERATWPGEDIARTVSEHGFPSNPVAVRSLGGFMSLGAKSKIPTVALSDFIVECFHARKQWM